MEDEIRINPNRHAQRQREARNKPKRTVNERLARIEAFLFDENE